MLQRLAGKEGQSLAAPLPHAQMRVLAHQQQVGGDGPPDGVQPAQVDQRSLQQLGHGKKGGFSVAGCKVHALVAEAAQGLNQVGNGRFTEVTRRLEEPEREEKYNSCIF